MAGILRLPGRMRIVCHTAVRRWGFPDQPTKHFTNLGEHAWLAGFHARALISGGCHGRGEVGRRTQLLHAVLTGPGIVALHGINVEALFGCRVRSSLFGHWD